LAATSAHSYGCLHYSAMVYYCSSSQYVCRLGENLSPAGDTLLIVVLLFVSAFFSASEVGFLAVGPTRVRELRDRGVRAAVVLSVLLSRRALILSTILTGITASNYTAERLAVSVAATIHPTLGPVIAALAMTAIVLVFCEVLPIQRASRDPERVALLGAAPIGLCALLLSPLVAAMAAISRLLLLLLGVRARTVLPSVTEEHLRAMIEQGEEEGAIAPTERRMLRGVLEFGDHTVAQVMTPRSDMVCIEEGQALSEALALGLERRHSRLPVFRATPDDIVGILHLKDLLPYALDGSLDRSVSSVARPAYHVPESLLADDLLAQLQQERQMMAIVRDEFGGTAGLVTVEDLLEEIVGDIRDEYDDTEEPEIVPEAPGKLLCSARVSLHELEAHLAHTELPTEEYESLGGLVLDLAGRIPQAGEVFSYKSLTLTVERTTRRRLETVRVVEAPVASDGELDESS
jgi:putative hemolysin